jgi:hypothetical protein
VIFTSCRRSSPAPHCEAQAVAADQSAHSKEIEALSRAQAEIAAPKRVARLPGKETLFEY